MSENVMMYGINPPTNSEDYLEKRKREIKENKKDRSWSDAKDHVIISIAGEELGMDLIAAIKLYKQLGEAIKKAI